MKDVKKRKNNKKGETVITPQHLWKRDLLKKTVLLLKHMKVWLWMLNYLSNSSPLEPTDRMNFKKQRNKNGKKNTKLNEKKQTDSV